MARHNKSRPKRQRGVVLIMALLIVAMVTTVVVAVSWRFNLSVVRNMNRWHGAQARVLLEAAEQFALQGLRLDVQNGPVDSLMEEWAQPVNAPSDFGMISGQLEDAHGRLNLNLMKSMPPPPPQPNQPRQPIPPREELYSLTQKMFLRLLQTIELESGQIDMSTAVQLVDAIEDWIDPDNVPIGFGGAESSYYESLDPPIAITNGEMATVSELSLVKGMTPELFKKLEPYVIALPGYAEEQTAVKPNINTLKPALLRSINSGDVLEPMDEATFTLVQEIRAMANAESPSPGFQSPAEFLNHPELKHLWLGKPPFEDKDVVVSSQYFLLFAQATIEDQTEGGGSEDGRTVRKAKSILFRPSGENTQGQLPRVVRRTDANF